MKNLEKDIKNKKFKQIYLFYGEEEYLKNHYLELLKKEMFDERNDLANIFTFQGKTADVKEIENAMETVSFFSPLKLIIVKNSELFVTGRKNDTAYIADSLKDVSDSTIIVFYEEKIDKRNGLYKQVAKIGKVMEFPIQKEGELLNWVIRRFNSLNIKIDNNTAAYFIKNVNKSMDSIINEIEKLSNYVTDEVKISHIDKVTTKTLEIRVFELVGALGEKNVSKALAVFENLMLMKESPIMILAMIARQFRIMLQIKGEKTENSKEIAQNLSLHPYVVSEGLRQGKNFSPQTLINGMKDTLSADVSIKSGLMNDRLAVEMLIIKYCE